MKQVLLIFILLVSRIFCVTIKGQTSDQSKIGNAYLFKTAFDIEASDVRGQQQHDTQSIPVNSLFNIVGETEQHYIISFGIWSAKHNDDSSKESSYSKRLRLNYFDNPGTKRKYFRIEKTKFEGVTSAIYKKSWNPVLGVLTYPFKYYPQDGGRLEKAFSVVMSGGYSFLFKSTVPNWSIAGTAGVGVSSVTLTPENSKVTSTQEGGAGTICFNIIYIHDRLQIAGSIGTDRLLNNNIHKWDRNGNIWFGVGIGVNIFNIDKPIKEIKGPQP